jgi:hypothetical protein
MIDSQKGKGTIFLADNQVLSSGGLSLLLIIKVNKGVLKTPPSLGTASELAKPRLQASYVLGWEDEKERVLLLIKLSFL